MNHLILAAVWLFFSFILGYLFLESDNIATFIGQVVLFIISMIYIKKALDNY